MSNQGYNWCNIAFRRFFHISTISKFLLNDFMHWEVSFTQLNLYSAFIMIWILVSALLVGLSWMLDLYLLKVRDYLRSRGLPTVLVQVFVFLPGSE